MNSMAKLKDRLHEALELRNKKAADLAKDLNIPKSAISQYLSGNRTIKDPVRLYAIAKYLDVAEAWLMGFDIPMARPIEQKNSDIKADIAVRMHTDKVFFDVVKTHYALDEEKIASVMQMLNAFGEHPVNKV